MLKRFVFVLLICCVLIKPCFSESKNNSKHPLVRLETTMGDVIMELYPDKAPISCENFIQYVEDGFYDNTLFHRVIRNFVVQGGGFVSGLRQRKTRAPIKNEANNGLSNLRGTVAMARSSVVDSATSQFFINLSDNKFLNFRNVSPQGYGYAVFGKIISGMNVVDAIQSMKTVRVGAYSDVPKKDILVKKVTLLRGGNGNNHK
jgi:peptidyl-prolyl cis-trans isomerase B (cyclophilin B)